MSTPATTAQRSHDLVVRRARASLDRRGQQVGGAPPRRPAIASRSEATSARNVQRFGNAIGVDAGQRVERLHRQLQARRRAEPSARAGSACSPHSTTPSTAERNVCRKNRTERRSSEASRVVDRLRARPRRCPMASHARTAGRRHGRSPRRSRAPRARHRPRPSRASRRSFVRRRVERDRRRHHPADDEAGVDERLDLTPYLRLGTATSETSRRRWVPT